MPTFEIGSEDFLLDGAPLQIRSGALHYFRVHPEHWRDRIRKARLMGLNTIETYVAWNFHASGPGQFRTDGSRDLGVFLDIVAEEGMYAVVRPGPYICAEWDNGGLPAWLFAEEGVRVRQNDPVFLGHVARYFDEILPVVAARQVDRGGPVLLVQVENEYGAYGEDKDYLRALVAMIREHGIDVPLTTCDQADDGMLARGGLPELHKTATFGSRTTERLALLRRHQPTGPLMCMEMWDGWFDSWGRPHHVTDPELFAADYDALLAVGASANLYMFHGGTNFGFTNGANHKGRYVPIVSSYDYDAPLAEDGSPTEKYFALRAVIGRYAEVPDELPEAARPSPTGQVLLDRRLPLGEVLGSLGQVRDWDHLPTVEEVGQWSGLTLYRTETLASDGVLSVAEVRDAAYAWLDGTPVGALWRTTGDRSLALPARPGTLELLVEDQGRVNYGPHIGESKGLIGPARVRGRELTRWQTVALELETLDERVLGPLRALPAEDPALPLAGPSFAAGTFTSDAERDLFLALGGWGRCLVWINGFLLGRYWSAGPTETLYLPAPLLHPGNNELVVLELLGASDTSVELAAAPRLGHTEE